MGKKYKKSKRKEKTLRNVMKEYNEEKASYEKYRDNAEELIALKTLSATEIEIQKILDKIKTKERVTLTRTLSFR